MIKRLLKMRKKAKKKKPAFMRQEYFKHPKLKKKWVRPRGKTSKLRRGEKARGKKPSVGFSSPKQVRGLSRQGIPEVRVFNPEQLSKEMENKRVLIASTVGKKKREEIMKKAESLGLKLANK